MKKSLGGCRWFIAVVAGILAGSGALEAAVQGPEEIWQGYDPRAQPLNEEILKSWEDNGASYKEVYFNGEKIDGKQVRIYGIYAAPKDGKDLPALLHIHGGGQTVNQDWLKEFSGRGYAILSINWGGEWPKRDRFTLWNGVTNGDHNKRKGSLITEPSPRSDAYFLWTQSSMRAITYLEISVVRAQRIYNNKAWPNTVVVKLNDVKSK